MNMLCPKCNNTVKFGFNSINNQKYSCKNCNYQFVPKNNQKRKFLKDELKKYYKNLIFNSRFSKETRVKEGCLLIIDFLFSKKNLDCKTSFYFEDLRKVIPNDFDDEDFITSVFYLTRKHIAILEQNFSAFDEKNGSYTSMPEFKNDVIEMIKNKNYYNPISRDDLTIEQFGEQILTYFNPTTKFINFLHQAK